MKKFAARLVEPGVAEGEGGLALEAQVLLQRQHRRAVQPPLLQQMHGAATVSTLAVLVSCVDTEYRSRTTAPDCQPYSGVVVTRCLISAVDAGLIITNSSCAAGRSFATGTAETSPNCPRVPHCAESRASPLSFAPAYSRPQTAHPRQLQQVQAQLPQGVPPPCGDLRQPLQQRPPCRPQLLLLLAAQLEPRLQAHAHLSPSSEAFDSTYKMPKQQLWRFCRVTSGLERQRGPSSFQAERQSWSTSLMFNTTRNAAQL